MHDFITFKTYIINLGTFKILIHYFPKKKTGRLERKREVRRRKEMESSKPKVELGDVQELQGEPGRAAHHNSHANMIRAFHRHHEGMHTLKYVDDVWAADAEGGEPKIVYLGGRDENSDEDNGEMKNELGKVAEGKVGEGKDTKEGSIAKPYATGNCGDEGKKTEEK